MAKNILELSIPDRIYFASFMPKQGDFIEMTLCKEILEKIEISSKEINEIEFKTETTGSQSSYKWNKKKEVPKIVEFSNAEKQFIKNEFNKKDKAKQITEELYDLAKKLINW